MPGRPVGKDTGTFQRSSAVAPDAIVAAKATAVAAVFNMFIVSPPKTFIRIERIILEKQDLV
jgi:hypothetical protein